MKQWMLWAAVAAIVTVAIIGTVSHQVPVRPRTDRAEGDPLRLVSLSPSVTEILFELGLEENLIGVSTACTYPDEAADIRRVGDMGAPDLELVQAIAPDLLIATSFRDTEMVRVIEATGAEVLLVDQGCLDEVVDSIRVIGRAAGHEERAANYAQGLRARIEEATVTVPEGERPRVFVELSPQPLSTGAKGTFLDDLIVRAGGSNIAHDMGTPWTRISPDEVVAHDPEIIIIAYMMDGDTQQSLERRVGWGRVSAVRTGWVIDTIDEDLIMRPGPRLVDGLEELGDLFRRYREQEQQ